MLRTTAFERAEALGWGVRELSRRCGVSRESLYKVKAGNRGPGPRMIEGLLRAFPNLAYRDLFMPDDRPTAA